MSENPTVQNTSTRESATATNGTATAGIVNPSWRTQDAVDLYGINLWGKKYFDVNSNGEVCVRLRDGDSTKLVSLHELVKGLEERGRDLPILLRFPDILETQIAEINDSFRNAMREAGYKGEYRGVYPIKVNQQEQVVSEISRAGRKYHYGLEAGSKAELVAALAYMHDPEAYIVCNGYKDAEFIDLALHATRMGIRTIIVVEMPEELPIILERAEALKVEPYIGVRIKLSTKSSGHWNDSGGDRSVFGLTVMQLVDVVDRLREAGKLSALKLLHYHQGSQIPNIRSIRDAASEAIRVYVELVKEGAPMGILDIGGGMAIDYDGSQTNFQGSCNYAMREYCADVIETLMGTLDAEEIPHPTIISECGRATVAHCSVLLFNVFEVTKFHPRTVPEKLPDDCPDMLRNLFEVFQSIVPRNLQESYNDALYYREEIRKQFQFGAISLRDRARGDHIFWNIVSKISKLMKKASKAVPLNMEDIESSLVDIYHVNFSVFQSLPDSWAIDQLFPVMPIHRLNEQPNSSGIMADITCDCDGKMDKFIDPHGIRSALPLHSLREHEDYILGVFLVGAYQETLGDLHNLLGDTHVASIRMEDGEIDYDREIEGDTIADVLSYVEFNPKDLVERFRELCESAVRRKSITAQERRQIMQAYEAGLRSYTYFQD